MKENKHSQPDNKKVVYELENLNGVIIAPQEQLEPLQNPMRCKAWFDAHRRFVSLEVVQQKRRMRYRPLLVTPHVRLYLHRDGKLYGTVRIDPSEDYWLQTLQDELDTMVNYAPECLLKHLASDEAEREEARR